MAVILVRPATGSGMLQLRKPWSTEMPAPYSRGRVRSFPYVAYDYISGKSLATVFAQSARQHSPIPTDHALLIAERLALALAAAYESRIQDERVLHGFVLPHLVMISNEGETRLLGFEVAPGLRDLAAGGWQDDGAPPLPRARGPDRRADRPSPTTSTRWAPSSSSC